MEIYWGITASRSYLRTIPPDEGVMISAGGLWKDSTQAFMRKRTWPWRRWMLDSGGYLMLLRRGDYPWHPDAYLKLVSEMQPTWAASMDYCCEPSLTLATNMSTEDRIRASAEMADYLCPRSDSIFPVLQGLEPEDYALSWQLTEHLRPRIVGIGSVCRRQRTRQIAYLCDCLRAIVPRALMKHGFGVKISALKRHEVRRFFTSIDTNAWEFWARGKKRRRCGITDMAAWTQYSKRLRSLQCLPTQAALW